MSTDVALKTRIRAWTIFFIAALVISGVTAIPLQPEIDALVQIVGPNFGVLSDWLTNVQSAIHDVNARWPFLALGTDWLAFGHIVIGLGFIGLLRDPVRNEWLLTWGFMACLLVLPWAWIFGAARGTPWGWRVIDSSFGIGGMVPLYFIRRSVDELKRRTAMGVS